MAWYYGTFACGCEGRVNIIGPTKHRDWKKERAFEKKCPECYEKWLESERERKTQKAAEQAKEMELPELQGTEKQVLWANTLRQKFIDTFEKFDNEKRLNDVLNYKFDIKKKLTLEDVRLILDYILTNKTDAKYFIDCRMDSAYDVIVREMKEALKTEEEIAEEHQEKSVKLESTVFPKNAITNVVAEITIKDDKISVMFEKNEKFREVVKSLGYKWNGIWERKINELTGSASDRAAELGNKLLNAGFPVMILDEEIRNNAINGVYEHECNRWILKRKKGTYEGWLVIKWYDKSDLYNKARKLPGSRYDSGSVLVRVERYKEVEEFAELYEFKFTKSSIEAIENYKEVSKNVTVVNPVEVKEVEHKDGLQEILNSSTEILDDLMEED